MNPHFKTFMYINGMADQILVYLFICLFVLDGIYRGVNTESKEKNYENLSKKINQQ